MMFWQEGRLGREAQRLLALRGDERVLDVGCATGWLTRRIAAALTAPSSGPGISVDQLPGMPDKGAVIAMQSPCPKIAGRISRKGRLA